MVNMSEQQTEQGSAVQKAERVVDDLEAKRAKCIQQGTDLQDERANVALAAHTGGKAERARLHDINGALSVQASELASIDAAIGAAGENLAAARAAEARAVDRKNALELRAALKEFISCGESLDEVAAALAEEGLALREALNRMHILGSPFPSHEQVNVLGTDAILTALAATPWRREFRTLSPRERRTFGALVREWASRIERTNIKPRLGEDEQQTTNEAA
jgi:hypothetical protein